MPFISEKNEAGDFAKMLIRVDRRRALGAYRAAAPLSRAAFFVLRGCGTSPLGRVCRWFPPSRSLAQRD